ncbi:MAG: hypothetical protein JSW05_12330, partial [Candidatus Thorarchaeota archaeon]
GIVLVVYSHLFRIFLLRFIDDGMPLVALDPSLDNITGFLPYFLLYGRLPDPLVNPGQFLALETLAMIGWTIIFMSTLLGMYYRWRKSDDSKLIYYVLLTLGAAILVVSPFLRTAIGEWSNDIVLSGNYLLAYFTEPLTNGMMPLFPYLAYGCFGGLVGISIASREKHRYVLGVVAVITIIMLFLGVMFTGDIEALPGAEPFTWDSHVNLFGRRALQLGFFFFLFLVGLALLDFRSEETRTRWSNRLGVVSTFGKLALTVYMLEGVMAVALGLLVAPLWPSWNLDLLNIALFGLFNAVIWYGILRVWKRYQFKGSMEWVMVWTVQKLSGKRSARFRE